MIDGKSRLRCCEARIGCVESCSRVVAGVTNTIERFYDAFGRDAGYALNGVRQSTLAYDPATGRLATMQVPFEQSNNPNNRRIRVRTY